MVLLNSQEYVELLNYKLLIVMNSQPPYEMLAMKFAEIERLEKLIEFHSNDVSILEELSTPFFLHSN